MRVNTLYKILITSYSFSIFSEAVILPIYAVFVQGIGGDILDASGAMAVFLITQGIFTILLHRLKWINRHRIPMMIFGWAVWVLGIAMYLVVSNVAILFITQIFTAIGSAIADPIFDQELARHTDHKNEEFEWGFFEGSVAIIQGLAALVGGLVVTATASLGLILVYYSRLEKSQGY